MNKQVLSAEQMQELIDMSIDISKASMCWIINNSKSLDWESTLETNEDIEFWTGIGLSVIPTFTLQDILEILPKPCYLNCIDNGFYQCKITTKNESITMNGTSPLNVAFPMLKWCKKNKYI